MIALAPRPAIALPSSPELERCELDPRLELLPLADCPAVFLENAEAAPTVDAGIITVAAGVSTIDVVHQGEWEEPTPLWFDDVRLVGASIDESCDAVAVIAIQPLSEHAACVAGLYAVTSGTTFGPSGRVVAVVDGVLLLLYDNALRYVLQPDVEPPVWRMVWHSPWRLPVARPAGAAPPPQPKGRRR